MKQYNFYGWQTADCKPADPTYENNPEQFREPHWQKQEKHERYNYLKAELLKKLEEL